MEVEKTKPIFIAWTNTDTTEGKGQQIPLAVCWSYFTAKRMGERGGVQGCNSEITEDKAMFIDGKWRVPGRIHNMSTEDSTNDKNMQVHLAAVQKAKDAGLSDEDISNLNWINML